MRLAAIAFFTLSLLVAPLPLSAQTATPPAPSSSSAEIRLLNEMLVQLQTMSQNNDQTINGAVLLLGFGFVLLMVVVLVVVAWAARGGLKPLWDIITAERRRADQAEASETHMRTLADSRDKAAEEYRKRTAESMERLANILEKIESGQQAQSRTDLAVTTINQHTTTTFSDAKAQLEQAAVHVEAAAKTVEDVVTKTDLKQQLEPIQNELKGIAETLRKKGDTGNLPTLPDTPAPPTLAETDAAKDTHIGDEP